MVCVGSPAQPLVSNIPICRFQTSSLWSEAPSGGGNRNGFSGHNCRASWDPSNTTHRVPGPSHSPDILAGAASPRSQVLPLKEALGFVVPSLWTHITISSSVKSSSSSLKPQVRMSCFPRAAATLRLVLLLGHTSQRRMREAEELQTALISSLIS